MSIEDRIESLKEQHKVLEAQLAVLLKHPSVPDEAVVRLKRKKLGVKDEITRLQNQRRDHRMASEMTL